MTITKETRTNPLILAYKKRYKLTDEQLREHQGFEHLRLHDGSLLTGYADFANALLNVKPTDSITIYPDYDPDGISGGKCGQACLELFDLGVSEINNYHSKTTTGYGLTPQAVDDLLEQYPNTTIILTVDNGIRTKAAVDYCYEKGIKVIVTDHHKPVAEDFPDKAIAVVNPNRIDKPETYPFKDICGAETIWKLCLAFAKQYKPSVYDLVENLQVLTSMAIITDIMPIENENRLLLHRCVELLNKRDWILEQVVRKDVSSSTYKGIFYGINNMLNLFDEHGSLPNGKVTYDTIGWNIGPLLNSARRMTKDSDLAVRIFEFDDVALHELYYLNETRKEQSNYEKELFLSTHDVNEMDDVYGIVYTKPDMNEGIAGLVAGEIAKVYHRPAIVLASDGIGSGRAPMAYNLFDIMTDVESNVQENVIKKWGGHEQAVGLTVVDEQTFTDTFNKYCEQFYKSPAFRQDVEETDGAIPITIDNQFLPSVIDSANNFFDTLKPFNRHVPQPFFTVKFSLADVDVSYMKGNRHVKFTSKYNPFFQIIAWSNGEKILALDGDESAIITVTGQMSKNVYNNEVNMQITSTLISIKR